jgi:iron complex outermembrane receptor protein
LFATTSTAFEPSTRVDARTGRIQGNDTTRGYEAGFKARISAWAVDWSAAVFTLYNQDISRRNPLLNDPIFDANQTQPQLVAAGEERFTGGRVEGRWVPAPGWSLGGRVAYVRAITTASPDIPEEVGRQLTRMPRLNAGASVAYRFAAGRLAGTSVSASYVYLGGHTAFYEDRNRFRLDLSGLWADGAECEPEPHEEALHAPVRPGGAQPARSRSAGRAGAHGGEAGVDGQLPDSLLKRRGESALPAGGGCFSLVGA